jgi:hypothetical protein
VRTTISRISLPKGFVQWFLSGWPFGEKEEAIAALLSQRTIEEVARVAK